MMKLLVTGGAGFIGSHVLEKLHAMADRQVVVFDNLTSGSPDNVPHGTGTGRCTGYGFP